MSNWSRGLTRRRFLEIACICIPATALKGFRSLLRSQPSSLPAEWKKYRELALSRQQMVAALLRPSEIVKAKGLSYLVEHYQKSFHKES